MILLCNLIIIKSAHVVPSAKIITGAENDQSCNFNNFVQTYLLDAENENYLSRNFENGSTFFHSQQPQATMCKVTPPIKMKDYQMI